MRVVVGKRCEEPCPSCTVCEASFVVPTVDVALRAVGDADEVTLGGGDASRWPGLAPFASSWGRGIRLEAPLAAFRAPGATARLTGLGVTEAVVSIDVTKLQLERTSDEQVAASVAEIERHGLSVALRLCARPVAFGRVASLISALAPRSCRIELVRQDVGGRPVPLAPDVVEGMLQSPGARFAGDRRRDAGYLPPCALPDLHARRPEIWTDVLAARSGRNTTLASCATCPQADLCHFSDRGAVEGALRSSSRASSPKRALPDIRCMEPWLKMELTDPDALVHQCCSDWTVGARGDRRVSTLREIWNGEGYRSARRTMLHGPIADLCRPICPRLHDGANGASRFSVIPGSPRFVENQERMLEDLAEGREELRSLPLNLGLCPSTYCNFDCIMCGYGRSPRRDIPDEVWDELPELLPTLSTLVLLGGEPLANPRTMTFLRTFDRSRWPDTGISITTNGSFLTRATLRHLTQVPFASVIVSVNAGTTETYEAVQRGVPFQTLLDNLDALVSFRASHASGGRLFDLRTGFVVQPANAHTLIEFGELTAARDLGIRLLPLHSNPSHSLDYYDDPDQVARVLESLDGFTTWAAARRPAWLTEISAVRSAIVAEAGRLEARRVTPERARLPVVGS